MPSIRASTMDNLGITTTTAPVMITSSTSQDAQTETFNGKSKGTNFN